MLSFMSSQLTVAKPSSWIRCAILAILAIIVTAPQIYAALQLTSGQGRIAAQSELEAKVAGKSAASDSVTQGNITIINR